MGTGAKYLDGLWQPGTGGMYLIGYSVTEIFYIFLMDLYCHCIISYNTEPTKSVGYMVGWSTDHPSDRPSRLVTGAAQFKKWDFQTSLFSEASIGTKSEGRLQILEPHQALNLLVISYGHHLNM